MELLKQIEQEGERRIQSVLAQAHRQAEELIAQTEREISAMRERTLQALSVQLEQERRAALSRARTQARAEFLRAKSQVADRLFEQLSTDISQLRADPARYKKFLQTCLQEAERTIAEPLILYGAAEDRAILQELAAHAGHKLGEPIPTLGGLLATNERGDLVVDNRLETRLATLRARYRVELGKSFFDRAGPD